MAFKHVNDSLKIGLNSLNLLNLNKVFSAQWMDIAEK